MSNLTLIYICAIGTMFLVPLCFIALVYPKKFDRDIEDICPFIKRHNQPKYFENGSICFPSKHSLIITVMSVGSLFPFVYMGIHGNVLFGFIAIIMSILFLWPFSTTGYTITSTRLLIKGGWLHREVELSSVKTVTHSNDFGHAPAWSLKRMKITTASNDLIISPVEEELFLKTLKQLAPQITINWPQ